MPEANLTCKQCGAPIVSKRQGKSQRRYCNQKCRSAFEAAKANRLAEASPNRTQWARDVDKRMKK